MVDGEGTERAVRWAPRTAALLTAGALFAAYGVYSKDASLLFLAIPLLVAPLVAFGGIPPASARGEVDWTASGGDRNVVVEGRITVPRGIPAEGVSLEFTPPDPLVESAPPEIERSPSQIRFRLSYVAEFPCLAVLPRPDASWNDPLGLVEVPIPLTGAALRLERFPPEIARLRTTHMRRTTVYPGEVRSPVRGGAGDFFAIRPSDTGDTPRQINWSASARAGQLLANDYLVERTGDLLIILDLRPTALGLRQDREILSMARAAAFGIADAFLHEKARVGLATFGEYATALRLGSGRLQRYRIHSALYAARVDEVAGPPERLAVSLTRYFPKGIGTLVISSLADEDAPVLLAHLRRRGFAPFVLAPSPLPLLDLSGAPADRAEQLATRLLRLTRRQRLAAAWREAPVVDWEDYWSLAPFVRFLARPQVRSGGSS
jgi:uncharacterized protein (DUF58 family)